MSQTLAQLQSNVRSLLNESTNTPVGNQATGSGGAPTVATSDQITFYLNEAKDHLCRTCHPVYGIGTGAYNPGSVNFGLESLTVADGSFLRAALQVGIGVTTATLSMQSEPPDIGNTLGDGLGDSLENPGTVSVSSASGGTTTQSLLPRLSREVALLYYPGWAVGFSTAPTPLYWVELLPRQIALLPVPTSSVTVSVYGLVIPPPLSNTGAAQTWMTGDLEKLLTWYACYQVCLKNDDDPSLKSRAAFWRDLYETGRMTLLHQLWAENPLLAEAHFEPLPQPQLVAGQG